MSQVRPKPNRFTADNAEDADTKKNFRPRLPLSAPSAKSAVKNPEPEIVPRPPALPRGWTMTTLEKLAGKDGLRADGDWVESKDQDPAGDVRLIQLADIGEGNFRNRSSRFLTSTKAAELGCTFLKKGDILIARMADPIGRACIFPGDTKAAVTVVDVCIFRAPDSRVDSRWLVAILNSASMRIRVIAMASGTTRGRISGSKLAQIPIPLPPLAEQRRIVARLEALEARSRRTRALLAEVPAQLAQARQSLLAAAFRGDLTAEWRGKHKATVTTATTMGTLIKRIEAGRSFRCVERPPVGVAAGIVKVSALTWGEFDEEESKTVEDEKDLDPKHRIQVGDLLVSRANTAELVGASVLVKHLTKRLFLSDKSLRLVVDDEWKRWLLFAFRSPDVIQQIADTATGNQHSMRNISQESLRGIRVKLPSVEERDEIVRRLEAALARMDAAARAHAAAVAELDRLDQSLLARAFSGTLVPQDPADEPARCVTGVTSPSRTRN